MKFRNVCLGLTVIPWLLLSPGCGHKPSGFYTAADFLKVSKIDVHFHYNTPDTRIMKFADSLNFRLVSPNVDAGVPIDSQLQAAVSIQKEFPGKLAFFGTFSVDSFGTAGFAEQTIARIQERMNAGACGIKVWKNIGMVLKDRAGQYVMVDDPGFKPVFNYLEVNEIPVMGHLGEPRNCWLPLEEMTLGNDFRYFTEHPQYHMYLHPEAPSYEDQINARDHLLQLHPGLFFTGAHLASLEWNVDELAKRLDTYPNLTADMTARIGHLQYQSLKDYDKVRDFLIRYQDRIMYGTDMSAGETGTDYTTSTAGLRTTWVDDWIYLATDSAIIVNDLGDKSVKGLKLPSEVIDRIYFKNAKRFFKTNNL